LKEFSLDHAVIEFEAGPQHANPMGTLAWGHPVRYFGCAMGTAWASGAAESESFTTID